MTWLDHIYITKERALKGGFSHEGFFFGVSIWAVLNPLYPDQIEVQPKWGLLQWWIELCCGAHAFLNSFREPEDQIDFSPALRRIKREIPV